MIAVLEGVLAVTDYTLRCAVAAGLVIAACYVVPS